MDPSAIHLVQVHPKTQNPKAAWQLMKDAGDQIVKNLNPMSLDTPIHPNKVRFVCISDTHSVTTRMKSPIPPGDILLHAGDFTRFGGDDEIKEFNTFLEKLPHKHKIVIAGNHDANFDKRFHISPPSYQPMDLNGFFKTLNLSDSSRLLPAATYLEDEAVTIYGIKIYGTPWQPVHIPGAFTISRGARCLEKWNLIPSDTDVLLTHTPPVGHGDLCRIGERAGCVELLNVVQQIVKPKYHVFGHIHEGYGQTTDGQTVFINCSTCNVSYNPINAPIIFDYPLPIDAMQVSTFEPPRRGEISLPSWDQTCYY